MIYLQGVTQATVWRRTQAKPSRTILVAACSSLTPLMLTLSSVLAAPTAAVMGLDMGSERMDTSSAAGLLTLSTAVHLRPHQEPQPCVDIEPPGNGPVPTCAALRANGNCHGWKFLHDGYCSRAVASASRDTSRRRWKQGMWLRRGRRPRGWRRRMLQLVRPQSLPCSTLDVGFQMATRWA